MPNIVFEDVELGEINAGRNCAMQWVGVAIKIGDAPLVKLTAQFSYLRKRGVWSVVRDDPNPPEYRHAHDGNWQELEGDDPNLGKALDALRWFEDVENQSEALEEARRSHLQGELDELEAKAAKLRELLAN